MQVLQNWGEYGHDVQFILQRSALEQSKKDNNPQPKQPQQMPAAVWKPPPSANSRLSPDSGRGSDRTIGSNDSNNDTNTNKKTTMSASAILPSQQQQQRPRQQQQHQFHSQSNFFPPAYRQPPPFRPPYGSSNGSSPADHPPPYRNPPPAPRGSAVPSGKGGNPMQPQQQLVRPHYSPPPTRSHLSRHPSRSSLMGGPAGAFASGSNNMSRSVELFFVMYILNNNELLQNEPTWVTIEATRIHAFE